MAYFHSAPSRRMARRCFARLIRQAETLELQPHSRPPSKRTALSVGKRSCSRFAALALRLRTETTLRDIPVLRMAYFPIPHRPTFGAPVFRSAYSASRNARASAAFAASIRPYHGLFYKTFDLQVRCANPTGNFAPKRPFGTFRCSVRLIRLCRNARTSAASRPTKGS